MRWSPYALLRRAIVLGALEIVASGARESVMENVTTPVL
jgi:hypothetical protein